MTQSLRYFCLFVFLPHYSYMQLVESLATYGVHYYEVKDKGGLPWWLGLSFKGIGQYDLADRVTPRKVGLKST